VNRIGAQKRRVALITEITADKNRSFRCPTDILDVSGAIYTYLINGHGPGANWTALFRPGERDGCASSTARR
jgi:hypothetical protein